MGADSATFSTRKIIENRMISIVFLRKWEVLGAPARPPKIIENVMISVSYHGSIRQIAVIVAASLLAHACHACACDAVIPGVKRNDFHCFGGKWEVMGAPVQPLKTLKAL